VLLSSIYRKAIFDDFGVEFYPITIDVNVRSQGGFFARSRAGAVANLRRAEWSTDIIAF
jgi:hypothetical protein